MIDITIPMLAPGLNGDKGLIRMHFAAYKKVKDSWTWALKAATREKAPIPCSIVIERYYAVHAMDVDNCYATAKLPIDSLRAAGILTDDDPSCVSSLQVRQMKVGSKKEERTRIIIT